jgi:hypothetical protein
MGNFKAQLAVLIVFLAGNFAMANCHFVISAEQIPAKIESLNAQIEQLNSQIAAEEKANEVLGGYHYSRTLENEMADNRQRARQWRTDRDGLQKQIKDYESALASGDLKKLEYAQNENLLRQQRLSARRAAAQSYDNTNPNYNWQYNRPAWEKNHADWEEKKDAIETDFDQQLKSLKEKYGIP